MSIRITILVVSLLLAPAAVRADEASKRAKVEKMLALSGTERTVQDALAATEKAQMAAIEQMELPAEVKPLTGKLIERMNAAMKPRLAWEVMKPKYVQIYMEVFSEEEVDGMNAFYASAAGQSFVKKMPLLMEKSMMITGELLRDLMPVMQKVINDMIEEQKARKL